MSVPPPIPPTGIAGASQTYGGARERTQSFKRRRTADEVTKDKPQNKTVNGTSVAGVNGRKMRSPPVDIFVWGVHKETTKEDIMNDLKESDINVEVKDIIKK